MNAVTSDPYQSAETHHSPAQNKRRVRDEVEGG